MRVHHLSPDADRQIALALSDMIDPRRALEIVCIGTDRSTGDSLGPHVGTYLQRRIGSPAVRIYGTIDAPIGATNIRPWLDESHDRNSLCLAVDASLGGIESVGYIYAHPHPLLPGRGLNKFLPPVGDCHVAGIVSISGFMEHYVLQNTRLALVQAMARVIARGITLAVESVFCQAAATTDLGW
jgi:putative sporulation protein YyaC